MKKNYWLIAIFLLLGGATAWYFLAGKNTATSTLGWDRLFKVPEADIQKIFLAKRTGETTTVERDGDGWKVNGQKASKNAVENLLEAVSNLELQSVPPPAATDNVVKELASRGIKVEVYGRRDQKLKTYYIGGVTANARGTYAIMDGSEQPMILEIPQMEGQIRTRFDLTGDDWRDRNVFAYKLEEIKAVSVEYPQQRNKSFQLKRTGGDNWEIKPFYDNVPAINQPVSKGKVEGFLVGFGSLMAESIENNFSKKDSIRQIMPFAVVSVMDVEGKELKAAFYPTYREDKYTGERRSEVVERYFADMNTGDWMLTQHRVFEKIFWPYEAFFEKPGVPVKN